MVSIDNQQHTHAMLYHYQDMVVLREKIFMRLQSSIASKEEVFIRAPETAARCLDTTFSLTGKEEAERIKWVEVFKHIGRTFD